jgi:hypothetical protein
VYEIVKREYIKISDKLAHQSTKEIDKKGSEIMKRSNIKEILARNFHKINFVELIGEILIKSRVLLVFSVVKLCNHLKKLNQVKVKS